MTTIGIDVEELAEAVAELTEPKQKYDRAEELVAAGQFVARFGAFTDLFDEPDLTTHQIWWGNADAAWAQLGHWSVEGGAPTKEASQSYIDHQDDCVTCPYLENVYDLRQYFGECDECGHGIVDHTIRPREDDPTDPEYLCPEPWERLLDQAALADDDRYQVGSSYSAHWAAPLDDDDAYAVVVRTYHLAVRDGRTIMQRNDAYLICEDPDRPFATELASAERDEVIDDYDPRTETPQSLAEESFDPEPGEWDDNKPEDGALLKLR